MKNSFRGNYTKIIFSAVLVALLAACSQSYNKAAKIEPSKNFSLTKETKSLLENSYKSAVLTCAVWIQKANSVNDPVNESLKPNIKMVFDFKGNVIPESQTSRIVLDEGDYTVNFTIKQIGFDLLDGETGVGTTSRHSDNLEVMLKVDEVFVFVNRGKDSGSTVTTVAENGPPYAVLSGSAGINTILTHQVSCQLVTVK
jgi:hypothetical protein